MNTILFVFGFFLIGLGIEVESAIIYSPGLTIIAYDQ